MFKKTNYFNKYYWFFLNLLSIFIEIFFIVNKKLKASMKMFLIDIKLKKNIKTIMIREVYNGLI
jgi:hypothetical protein